MTYIFLFLLAYIIYFKVKYNGSNFINHKSFRFNSFDGIIQYSEITKGRKVNLWNKPGTIELRVYLIGANPGAKAIGRFKNKEIADKLKENPDLRIRGIVKRKNIFGRVYLEENLIYNE